MQQHYASQAPQKTLGPVSGGGIGSERTPYTGSTIGGGGGWAGVAHSAADLFRTNPQPGAGTISGTQGGTVTAGGFHMPFGAAANYLNNNGGRALPPSNVGIQQNQHIFQRPQGLLF